MMFRAFGACDDPSRRRKESGSRPASPLVPPTRLTPLRDSPPRLLETRLSSGILDPSRVAFFGVSHGPPCQLERLFAPFARDLPGCPVSGDVGYRKSQLQPDQPQDRP